MIISQNDSIASKSYFERANNLNSESATKKLFFRNNNKRIFNSNLYG